MGWTRFYHQALPRRPVGELRLRAAQLPVTLAALRWLPWRWEVC